MQSKSQVLVNMRSGDRVVFDVEGLVGWNRFSDMLSNYKEWIEIPNKAMLRKSEIISVYYMPEGYAKNSEGNVPKA